MTARSTILRDRMASVAPSMAWREWGPSAVRQWRFRHWDEIRRRTEPPKVSLLANPFSSLFNRVPG